MQTSSLPVHTSGLLHAGAYLFLFTRLNAVSHCIKQIIFAKKIHEQIPHEGVVLPGKLQAGPTEKLHRLHAGPIGQFEHILHNLD